MPRGFVVYGCDKILGGGLVNLGSFQTKDKAQVEFDAPRRDGYVPTRIVECTPDNPWGRAC